MRDGLEFSKALKKKILEWKDTEHFSQSKTGKTKITRALDLVSGTNPKILEKLGINNIPSDPYKALLSVRGTDERTVQGLEIFRTAGQGKLTGHHGTPAAAIGRALAVMDTDNQEYVFKKLEDMYVKHGMDPAGILSVDGKKVHMAAHGGDWTGQRTGASLIPVAGEKGSDFMKRFEKAYDIQMDLNETAMGMDLTKDWDAAFEGGAEALGMKGTDLNSSATSPEIRSGATSIMRPSASEVKAIVQSNSGNPSQIKAQTQKIVSSGLDNLNKPNRSLLSTIQELATPNGGASAAVRWGRQQFNANGLGAVGGLMMDPDAMEQMMQGDIAGGIQTGAGNMIKGEAFSQVLQKGLQIAGPKLGGVAKVLGGIAPLATVAAGTSTANTVLKTATGDGYVDTLKKVQDKDRTKQINADHVTNTQQLNINRPQNFGDTLTNQIQKGAQSLLSIFQS